MSRANLTSHDLIQLSFAWQTHGSVLFFSICLMRYYLISGILKQKQCIYLQKTKYLWQWPAKHSANRGKSVLNLPTFSHFWILIVSEGKQSFIWELYRREENARRYICIPNPFMIAAKDGQSQNSSKFLNFICFETCWEKKILCERTAKEVSIECSYHRIQNLQPPCETATFNLAGTVVKG